MLEGPVRRNDIGAFRQALAKSSDWGPDYRLSQLTKALYLACQNGNVVIVELLLDNGAPIEGDGADTPLHLVASNGYVVIAELLLLRGASVDPRDSGGEAPLHLASRNGHLGIVELLLRYGADIELREGLNGMLPLHLACWAGHPAVAEVLLDRGAAPDALDGNGDAAIHLASQCGEFDIVRLLLDHGATVDAQGEFGWTPLHHASDLGYPNIVQLLLDRGTDVDVLNKVGNTSLHMASRAGHSSVVELLVAEGADIHAKGRASGRSPLHFASLNGHLAVSKLLLSYGADVDERDNQGDTPLHLACQEDHTAVADMLLNSGAIIEAQNVDHWTPLHLASRQGHSNIVELLLSRGADAVAGGGKDESTPLHLAFEFGHAGLGEMLMNRGGASITATDKHGRTPLDVANLGVPDSVQRQRTARPKIIESIKSNITENWLVYAIISPIVLVFGSIILMSIIGSIISNITPASRMDCNYVHDEEELKFTALYAAPFYKKWGALRHLNGDSSDLAYVEFQTKEKMNGAIIPSLVGDSEINENVSIDIAQLFEKMFSVEDIEPDKIYEVTCTGYAITSVSGNSVHKFGTGVFTLSGSDLAYAASTEGEVSEPTINLHAERTSVRLGGELIKLNLSIVHTILTEHELTTNLIFTVPSGWSLEFGDSPAVSSQACSGGQCNAVYRLRPGQQRAIVVLIRPNQEGDFIVSARVELQYGENSDIQTHRIPVSVTK